MYIGVNPIYVYMYMFMYIHMAVNLAFTRYVYYQYFMAYIAIKGGQGDLIYCTIV